MQQKSRYTEPVWGGRDSQKVLGACGMPESSHLKSTKFKWAAKFDASAAKTGTGTFYAFHKSIVLPQFPRFPCRKSISVRFLPRHSLSSRPSLAVIRSI